MTEQLAASIESLIDQYDFFLFDQFGVLHDGVAVYDGMHGTLASIKRAGKKTAVISNSGKRAAYNQSRLAQFGFDDELIDSVVTSGEVAWHSLIQLASGDAMNLSSAGKTHIQVENSVSAADTTAKHVFYVGRGNDRSALEGLPLAETLDAAEADLVLISGSEGESMSLAQYRERLLPFAQRRIPAICTNPDRIMMVGRGNPHFGAGRIAEAYEELGGDVSWIGKPYPAIYEHVLAACEVSAERTLCIGDSVEHDIAGANAAGCASLLVDTGIHADANDAERAALYRQYQAVPTYVLHR